MGARRSTRIGDLATEAHGAVTGERAACEIADSLKRRGALWVKVKRDGEGGGPGMAMRRERDIEFSQPVRQIVLMLFVLAAVGGIGWFLYEPIQTVFYANIYLNGLIVAVFVIGVLACFRAVTQMISAVSWIEGFATNRPGHEFVEPPRLLTSLAALLRDSRSRSSISATSARTILDSVGTRLDERRDVTRYLANLLIFLGLLGTFWGLSNTVPAVVETIRSLAPDQDGGSVGAFDRLMAGLEDQLGGMGTAFASSLLGLAGSLVIGLLELFAGHAQNRFYRELEEWLSGITRVGLADGEGGAEGLMAALVEQNATQIETLSDLLGRNDERREGFETRIAALTDTVSRLAASLDGRQQQQQIDPQMIVRQTELLAHIAERLDRAPVSGDDDDYEDDHELRARVRNIDMQLLRLLEEMAVGRQDTVAELRAELNGLSRAVMTLAESAREVHR